MLLKCRYNPLNNSQHIKNMNIKGTHTLGPNNARRVFGPILLRGGIHCHCHVMVVMVMVMVVVVVVVVVVCCGGDGNGVGDVVACSVIRSSDAEMPAQGRS